jgi:hypothetical protein
MALTKISTGGVKDDAASQAKIADEAVDEARLQISNDGTNGQFLSKQTGNTGGLTWATVTVPDSDKIEEGNTSIETVDTGSDGHVKISTEGTERLRVVADGKIGVGVSAPGTELDVVGTARANNFALRTNGSAPTADASVFRAADNTLAFATANTERIRISAAGQLGVAGANYGTSGQVLTSGGASAAPSWADAGGGAWESLTSGSNASAQNDAGTIIDGLDSTYSAYYVIKVEFYIHFSNNTSYAGFQFKAGNSWNTNNTYHSQCEYGRHNNSSHMTQDTNSNSSITLNEDSNDRCENIAGTLSWYRGPNSEDAMIQWDAKAMAYSGANYDFLLFNGAGGNWDITNNQLQGIQWKNSNTSNIWWRAIGMK